MSTPPANTRRVPFFEMPSFDPETRAEIDAAMAGAVDRGDFILGAEVERFEQDFADYCGVDHAIGVASGTAALQIAVSSLGIEAGAEVIVPAHTYVASAFGPLHAGAVPVFCDVNAETGLIDPDAAATVITDRTAAIVAVHLYGQVCDPGPLRELADARGIALIEDAAQAHGASFLDQRAGSMGDVAAFSFYPSKNLGAFGDAGMLTTSNGDVAALARRWRNLGQFTKGEHDVPGMNARLDTLQATILRIKLRLLDGWNESRREVAGAYREHLGGTECPILAEREGFEDVHHLYPVLVDDRDRVRSELDTAGIGTGIHYTPAVHHQPPFAAAERGGFPNAESWARKELSMPMFPGLDADAVARASAALLTATRAE